MLNVNIICAYHMGPGVLGALLHLLGGRLPQWVSEKMTWTWLCQTLCNLMCPTSMGWSQNHKNIILIGTLSFTSSWGLGFSAPFCHWFISDGPGSASLPMAGQPESAGADGVRPR